MRNIKKILSISLIILVLASIVRFWLIKPKEVRADALLGFNEGYGTTVSDNNGSVSGTITNALWRSEELCKSGKCLFFDGTGDLVSFGDDADLDFAAATNFTLEGWFRTPDITSGTRVLVAKYNSAIGTDGGYKVYMDASGYLVFGIDDDQTTFPEDSASTSTSAFDDNKWHFFTAVKTGTTSITIYVDGIQYQTDSTISATGTLANTDTFYIGIDGDGSTSGFSGFLDEVKVYTGLARTAAEIKADFVGETPSRGTAASFGPTQDYLSNGLVGYWKMEEAGDATRADSSGNGNTLTESALDTVAQAAGKFGYAGDFELDDTEYMTTADSSSLSVTGSVTLSAWIKPEIVSAGAYNILAKWDGSNESYRLMQNADEIRIELDASGNYVETTGTNLAAATWYHVAGVFDASSATAKVFVNGLEATTSTTGTIPSSIGDDTGVLSMGAEDTSSTPTGYYDGIIDEGRIYNRALSPAEISSLYNWAPGPVGYWKMDEISSPTQDSSGNGNSGTWNNDTMAATGKFGNAISIDGTADYLAVGSPAVLDNLPAMTIGSWVYTNADDGRIVDKQTNTNTAGWKFEYFSSGTHLRFVVDYDGASDLIVEPSTNLSASTWYHVAVTWDGTLNASGVKMYINGVLQSAFTTNTSGIGSRVDDNAQTVGIGCRDTAGGAQCTSGKIDDVRIYDYARTPSQIIEDMNAGHPTPGSPVGSAVGYWKMDEGYGTTTNDTSPNANNLTLSTASWTNSGKFGKAWNGTGALWVSRANDADLDFAAAEDFTLSGWFKSDSATNPTNGTEYILSTSTGNTDAGYQIYTKTDGTVCFGIDDDGTWTDVESCTTTDYYDGLWHQFTAVRNVTSDTTKIYIDAIERDSDTDPTTGTLDGDNIFYIGDFDGDDNATAGTEEFAGDIDEVKVYRSVLTADQVKVEYNKGSGQNLGALSTDSTGIPSWSDTDSYCPPGQGSTCTPPIAHWKLDENTGTTANDVSTTGNGGTLTNGPEWRNGMRGAALNFDASDDLINLGTPTTFANLSALTISAWIYPRSEGETNAGKVICNTDGSTTCISSSGGWRWGVETTVNGLDFGVKYNTTSLSRESGSNFWTANQWQHVTVTWDGSATATNIHMYLNGVEEDSYGTGTNGSTTRSDDDAATMIIGGNGVPNTRTWDGLIDDVKIYNYVRTPAQIAWDMNRGGPVGWWKLDENTGTTANDSSEFGNTGTLTNTPTWVAGKYNTAASFAATNQHITRADDPDFDFAASQPFTVSTWFKHTAASATEALITKLESTGTDGGYKLKMESDGDITCETDDDDADTTIDDAATTTAATYDDNSWHHVACVYDTANTDLLIYIDGILTASNTTTTTNSLANDDALFFGIEAATGTEDWVGQLDDTRIYRYPLTAQQIRTVMNEGAAVKY